MPQGSQPYLFLYWNVFFPNSYTSWLPSTTKEAHLDYEAIFLQPFFLHTNHGQASTTTNTHYCSLLKEIIPPGHRGCQSSASNAHVSPTPPLRGYKNTNSLCLEIKQRFSSPISHSGCLIPIRNSSRA